MNFLRRLRTTLPTLSLALAAPAMAGSPPPLDAYGDLPAIEDMTISPSGKGIALVGKVSGQRQLLVMDDKLSLRANIPIGDTKLHYIEWAGEDFVNMVIGKTERLGYGFTRDKTELLGTLIIPLTGGKPEMVFNRTPSIARAIWGNYGIRFLDGHWLGYFASFEYGRSADGSGYVFDHGRPALFAVDLQNNRPQKIAQAASENHWNRWLVDGEGKVAVTLDVSSVKGTWKITNAEDDTLVSGVDPTGNVNLVSLGNKGASVIYSLEDDANQKIRWFEVPLAGGSPHEIFADTDIERTYVSPQDGRLLGYLDGNSLKPVLFDPEQQKALSKVYRAFPKLDVDIIQWTPDFGHFLVRTSGNGDSGTWFAVDIARRKADPLGDERPQILPEQVGPISTVNYKAADGLELDGILTLPPGREAKNLPVIMFPHGGPHAHNKAAFDWWAQAFASRGYAVFQPNFRGSTNRDQAFVRAGYGQWGHKMQTDISDGLSELVKQGIVNPKRACIMGASYGGYASLAGVTLQNGLYRCAVAVAPVSDLRDMYWTEYRESGENKMLQRKLEESLGDPKTFDEISPRRHANRADAPILLIHGKDDTIVAFNQSTAMAAALKDAGKPYEMVVLREEDHWLSHAATRKQMLEEAMRFIQKYNPAD